MAPFPLDPSTLMQIDEFGDTVSGVHFGSLSGTNWICATSWDGTARVYTMDASFRATQLHKVQLPAPAVASASFPDLPIVVVACTNGRVYALKIDDATLLCVAATNAADYAFVDVACAALPHGNFVACAETNGLESRIVLADLAQAQAPQAPPAPPALSFRVPEQVTALTTGHFTMPQTANRSGFTPWVGLFWATLTSTMVFPPRATQHPQNVQHIKYAQEQKCFGAGRQALVRFGALNLTKNAAHPNADLIAESLADSNSGQVLHMRVDETSRVLFCGMSCGRLAMVNINETLPQHGQRSVPWVASTQRSVGGAQAQNAISLRVEWENDPSGQRRTDADGVPQTNLFQCNAVAPCSMALQGGAAAATCLITAGDGMGQLVAVNVGRRKFTQLRHYLPARAPITALAALPVAGAGLVLAAGTGNDWAAGAGAASRPPSTLSLVLVPAAQLAPANN